AVLGPSVMEPALPGRPGQPPWAFSAHPAPWLVVGLAAAALLAGTGGLGVCLHAVHRGWTVPPRAVLLAGLVAAGVIATLPPFGSADQLSYAAYGRMVVTGHDPYTMTPVMLAQLGDPVARAVQDWRGSASVYGSLATGLQALASAAGGTSVRLAVFAGSVLTAVAFAAAGLLLHRMTRGSRAGQLRAALLWTANPLLLQVLVAGAHVDSEAIVLALAGVAGCVLALRRARSWWLLGGCAVAGGLAALGAAVKLSMALAPGGMIAALVAAWLAPAGAWPGSGRLRSGRLGPGWHGWRGPSRARAGVAAAGLAAGFLLVTAVALTPWGPGSLRPALQDAGLVSVGSPWRAVRSALRVVAGLPEGTADGIVRAAALAVALLLLTLLLRALVLIPVPQLPGVAVAGAFAAAFAWLLTWPYVLPWYDGLGWALLALLPATPGQAGPVGAWGGRRVGLVVALDWLLLARTAALSLGYLPARGIRMPAGLGWLETVVRTAVTPVALLAVLLLLAVLIWPRPAGLLPAAPGQAER
ncbi:MAG: hypothetical protein ACHP9Z_25245, partial [Streptosporangiales bacterium]